MIVISAGAGLGNQMFEYAFYLRMCEVYPGEVIKLDSRYAFPVAHNGYEIEKIFGVSARKASLIEVFRLSGRCPIGIPFYDKVVELYRRRYRKYGEKRSHIKQDSFHKYYEKFFELPIPGNYYCYGPFCNYKYIEKLEVDITKVFQFPPINDINRKWAEKIQNSNSVSIHIRRGDYLDGNVKTTNEEYYYESIAYLDRQFGECTYFVFSDDVEYVKRIFGDKNNFFIIDCNRGSESYRDMQLMSLCKHNIITNSTFSFWGAYLNRNIEKIVIAPDLSFVGSKDYCWPETWKVIERRNGD